MAENATTHSLKPPREGELTEGAVVAVAVGGYIHISQCWRTSETQWTSAFSQLHVFEMSSVHVGCVLSGLSMITSCLDPLHLTSSSLCLKWNASYSMLFIVNNSHKMTETNNSESLGSQVMCSIHQLTPGIIVLTWINVEFKYDTVIN